MISKEQKQANCIKLGPAIIKKPLHLIYKVMGPKHIDSLVAKQAAAEGRGDIVNRIARRVNLIA